MLLFLNACIQSPEPAPSPSLESTPPVKQESAKSGGISNFENDFKEGLQEKQADSRSDSRSASRIKLLLSEKVICIDPGHQPKMDRKKVPIAPEASFLMPEYSIGTKGVESGTFEFDIALRVAQKLGRKLVSLGADIVMTRDIGTEKVGNTERAMIANNADADITISLHCDGIEDPAISGISVLYPGDKYIKDQEILDKSLLLSQSILRNTVEATEAKNRGLTRRNDLIVFNYSRVPGTLIEMGFLTNSQEDRLLNSDEYQDKIAEGIIQGIINYFKQIEHQNEE